MADALSTDAKGGLPRGNGVTWTHGKGEDVSRKKFVLKLRTPWRAVMAMFFLNGALFGIWASRIPAIKLRLGLGDGALGLLLLCLAAGAIIAFPIAGRLSDHFGAARMTRFFAQFYVLTLVLLPLAATPIELGAALVLFGMAHGAMDVAMNGWGAEIENRLKHPIMSSLHAAFSLGAGLGAASGYAAIALDMSVALHFWLFGIGLGAITLSLATIAWLRPAPHPSTGSFLLPHGALILVGVIAFCSSIGEGAMADWSAVFLHGVIGVTEAKAVFGYTAFSTAMVVMRIAGDRLVARFGAVATLRASGVVSSIGVICIIAGGSYEVALAGFVLVGLGYANIMPIAFSRAANDTRTPPGRAIAAVATLGYGGMLIGPPTIGFVAAFSTLSTSFVLLAALAVAITLLAGSVGNK